MARPTSPRPTDRELEILQVIWDHGPSTVREVFRILNDTRSTGYTTVLKQMQIMTDKGLLDRDDGHRPQRYMARQSQAEAQRDLVGDLVNRVFKGEPGSLVLQALSEKATTPEEREKIRALLDRLEEEGTP